MAEKTDYYELLGVDKGSSADAIKKAYRKKAMEWHPDRNKSEGAEAKFKEINQAYEVLSDEKKRAQYDKFGHAAFSPGSGFPGAGFPGGASSRAYRSGPFTYTYTSSGDMPFGEAGFSDPFEIFEQFFGGGSSVGGQHRATPRAHYSIRVGFMEAMKGVEKQVVIEGKQHTIKIPAGAHDGTRIRYNDFDVTVDVLPDEKFRREGDDLFVDHHIPLPLAIQGGTTQVPTIDGSVKIKVKSGTESHTMVRLSGQGAPRLRGSGRGDLYARMIVDIPKNLSRKGKKLVKDLEKELGK